MDIKHLINESRRVKGAVTLEDAMDRLIIGQEVFILINSHQNLAVIKGEVAFIQSMELLEPDIKVTIEFKGQKGPVIQAMLLGGALNGKSAYVGDEVDGILTRIFTSMDDSIKYFEQVQFVRELKTLERTSNVSGFISRLLAHRQKPQKDL